MVSVAAQKLGIVADDLTGAMDSSGYFARLGYGTVVVLDAAFSSDVSVLVITTNSRAEAPDIARNLVRQTMRNMTGRTVYKKIDSTLRGNIGEELEVMAAALSSEKVVVAPAFPAVGRTTLNGLLLVNGVPVAETQFADDPISPVKESSIPRLLEQSMGKPVGCVTITEIEAGPEALKQTISNRPEKVVVCDVMEPFHLGHIARAATLVKGSWLLCGSGGLARELYLLLAETPKLEMELKNQESGIALVAVGTRNKVAADQLLRAQNELGIPILNLESEKLKREETLKEAIDLIDSGRGLALSSTFSQYQPELKQSIPKIMAEILTCILASQRFTGLFLSGGDIAVEVCRHLEVSAIRVHGEVEPGVPAGELIGGPYNGMRVVTKAGGFGTEETIVKSVAYLERGEMS